MDKSFPVWRPITRMKRDLVRGGGVVNRPQAIPGSAGDRHYVTVEPMLSEDSWRERNQRLWHVVRRTPTISPPSLPTPITITDDPRFASENTVLICGSWHTCSAYYRCMMEFPHGPPEHNQQAGCTMCQIYFEGKLPVDLAGSRVTCQQCDTAYDIVSMSNGSWATIMPVYRQHLVARFRQMAVSDKPEFIRWMMAYTMVREAYNSMETLSHGMVLTQLYAGVMLFYSPFPGGRSDDFRDNVCAELAKVETHDYVRGFDWFRRRVRNKFVAHLEADATGDDYHGIALQPPPLMNWWAASLGLKAHLPLTAGHMTAFCNLAEVTMLMWFYNLERVPESAQVLPTSRYFDPNHQEYLFKEDK